jgi:spoIIIJ-associated protein
MKLSEIDKKDLTKNLEQALSEITDFLDLEMEYDFSIIEYKTKDGEERELLSVQLKGDGALLIGYHGKTLDQIQHLISLALSNKYKQIVRVMLDINDYRKNRSEHLESLAKRAAQQVIDSNQEMELEPMKPAERRVIHNALSQEKEVSTESTGEGMERRVVVKPIAKK